MTHPRRAASAAVFAVLAILAVVGSVLAVTVYPTGREPGTSTAIRENTAGTTLTWMFGASYAAWAMGLTRQCGGGN